MEREELLKALRRQEVMDNLRCLGCGHEHHCSTKGCAINRAAAELIEQLEAENEALRHPPNPPLTLEQLREMDGEQVWVVQPYDLLPPFCGIVDTGDESVSNSKYCANFEDYDTEWLAYRRKPEADVSNLDTSKGEEG